MLSTVTWINPSGGDWDTPGNWNTGSVPGPADDAVINVAGNVQITHSQKVTDNVKSITGSDPLSISGGSLQVSGQLSDSGLVRASPPICTTSFQEIDDFLFAS
jgi:hypothetical protein